jgi:hypothetical protein
MSNGGTSDTAIPVINLPSSYSGLLIDSKGRRSNDTPYKFTTGLAAGVSCDSLTYKNLQWCQAIYSHTGESSAFMFDILQTEDPITGTATNKWYPAYENDEDYLNCHYVIYHKPYQFYSKFDGNEEGTTGGPYASPKVGSYAYDVETALISDIRITNNNLIPVNNSSLEDAFPGITFYFRYSSSLGFRLTAEYRNMADEIEPLQIRLWTCPSIQIAHRVHGYGVLSNWDPLDINRGNIKNDNQLFSMINRNTIAKQWIPAWVSYFATSYNISYLLQQGGIPLSNPTTGGSYVNYSDATPTLIPIRNINIYCPELTFNKKLQSYRSNNAVSQYGNNELAMFPVSLANAIKMTTLVAGDDSNVWSLREGYSPQQVTMIITDEDGNDLTASDCWSVFFFQGLWSLPATIDSREIFVPLGSGTRIPISMNYLLFGIPNVTTPGIHNLTTSWGDPTAVALKTTDVVHLLLAINA